MNGSVEIRFDVQDATYFGVPCKVVHGQSHVTVVFDAKDAQVTGFMEGLTAPITPTQLRAVAKCLNDLADKRDAPVWDGDSCVKNGRLVGFVRLADRPPETGVRFRWQTSEYNKPDYDYGFCETRDQAKAAVEYRVKV